MASSLPARHGSVADYSNIPSLEWIIKCEGWSYHAFWAFNVTVDVGGAADFLYAVVVMDMTEDVKAGADALYGLQEVGAAMADPAILVQDAAGRNMGDENVGIFRDQCPFLTHGLASGQGKGITGRGVESWLPGGSVELDAGNGCLFILEIDRIPE